MVNFFSVLILITRFWFASCTHQLQRRSAVALHLLSGTTTVKYGPLTLCPVGKWAIGFTTKVEPALGNGDDTAMNGVGLICGSKDIIDTVTITSDTGPWGSWKKHRATCEEGYIGARLKVEEHLGDGDDTSVNSIQLMCKCRVAYESVNAGAWGDWEEWRMCGDGKRIIGIQTAVQPYQGKGDDTALNDVRLVCGN